jgi:FemAB family protein
MIDWRCVFSESDLDVVFRVENPVLWDETYKRLPFRPVSYLASALDYQLAYQRGHGGEWQELSCVLRANNEAVAIWPLTIAECSGVASLSSQGLTLMPPLFVPECPALTRKKLTAHSLRIANRLATLLGLAEWYSLSVFIDRAEIDDWQLSAMVQGARCSVRHQLYVDLRLTLPVIKSGFRKSFRSLVTSGERQWRVDILRAPGDAAVWEEFRLLHAEVAGRVTRSLESWQSQHAALASDEGFLVVLRDASGRMVGAGYFMCSADEGVYAVAAYDRSLFDKPLGHVVQYRAIEEMQRRGCKWYRIGRRDFPSDEPAPNAKELAIAMFKQGFASHVLPSFFLTHIVNTEHV